MAKSVNWKFFRAGGFDQIRLETAADLKNLGVLDQKLWVALACPTSGLEVDARTLSMIDGDKDGRVRAPELIAAVDFAYRLLRNPDELFRGDNTLPLAAIADESNEGKLLLSSARQVLTNLGKPNDDAISADDLSDPARIFAGTPFNGDGIITELSSEEPSVKQVLAEILDCFPSKADRSGKPGVDQALVTTFFDEVSAYALWLETVDGSPDIWPIGKEKTAAAMAAVAAVRGKIDDYFARCRLAAFDPSIAGALNRPVESYAEVTARDISASAIELAEFPLAQVGPDHRLALLGAVNPAHSAALRRLFDEAVVPLIGPEERLTEDDWNALTTRLAPYEHWLSQKPVVHIEKLGHERIRELAGSSMKSLLLELLEQDNALEAQAGSIEDVERLVRYYRDLVRICRNFVNFADFYDSDDPAIFQCGRLYLDQRECHLCLRVEDPAKHATMAGLSGAYLVYLDCSRPASGEKLQIVAAMTAGDGDNLMVGRNGLFYDRAGRDWDATVSKIVDNPISLRQAFWAPYKKLGRMVEEYVAKRAAAADAESNSKLSEVAVRAANTGATPPTEPKKIDVGSVAALGVAVGALGAFVTALVGYVTGIIKLGIIATAAASIGLMLLISTPSVILAYITLRKRNLGPILDANGWAINAKARINVAFGSRLTSVARVPLGARRELHDRFVDKGPPWKRVVVALLLLGLIYRWYDGTLDRVLPANIQSTRILGRLAPAHPPARAPVP